jgi:hypothetical protein
MAAVSRTNSPNADVRALRVIAASGRPVCVCGSVAIATPLRRSCDDEAQAAFGSVWSGATALTRSSDGGRTRSAPTVLGGDRDRHGEPGRNRMKAQTAGSTTEFVDPEIDSERDADEDEHGSNAERWADGVSKQRGGGSHCGFRGSQPPVPIDASRRFRLKPAGDSDEACRG